MPYNKTKLKGGKVRVTSPSGVRAKATTPAKADAQLRLLRGIEHNPEFRDKLRKRVMQHD
jgi:hypothetical protein